MYPPDASWNGPPDDSSRSRSQARAGRFVVRELLPDQEARRGRDIRGTDHAIVVRGQATDHELFRLVL